MKLYFILILIPLFILTRLSNFVYPQKNSNQLPEPKIEISDTKLANQYFDKAKKFDEAAQNDSCIFYLKKAGVLYEKVASKYQAEKIWEKYIQCFNGIGNKLWRKAEFDKAMLYLNNGLNIGTKILGEYHPEIA